MAVKGELKGLLEQVPSSGRLWSGSTSSP